MQTKKLPSLGIDGVQRNEQTEKQISQNVAEVFKTPTGAEVIKYLRSITIELVHGPNVSTEQLRHIEGQRYIIGLLEQRIQHAHRSKNK